MRGLSSPAAGRFGGKQKKIAEAKSATMWIFEVGDLLLRETPVWVWVSMFYRRALCREEKAAAPLVCVWLLEKPVGTVYYSVSCRMPCAMFAVAFDVFCSAR